MKQNQDYTLYHKFIFDFLPIGFNGIDPNDPLLFEIEKSTERNNQYFFVADLLMGKILFASRRSINMIGIDPKDLNPYHTIEATHPEEVHRNTKGWAKLISIGNDLLESKGGFSLFATNMKLRNPEGEYSETLFQCYLFYSEIPYKTIYSLQVHTNIDRFKKIKKGVYYYSGNDLSYFRYPDDALLTLSKDFTKRELEIIRLIGAGMGTDQIANKLFLSKFTVNSHRANILKKSGKAHFAELIYELMKEGKL